MQKVFVIEWKQDIKGPPSIPPVQRVAYYSVFGWTSKEQAMTWADHTMANTQLSNMVLPAGVVRVVEIDRPDDIKPLPGVQTDYNPFASSL